MKYNIDDFLDLVRMEAADVVAERQFPGTLVTTAYDPERHMVKGMIMPHEVESGWVRISVVHAGDGFGIVVGPNVGDPKKLDGDQFDLHFENGDPNNLIAKHKSFSQGQKPPKVESGEIGVVHQSKMQLVMAKDGSGAFSHGKGGTFAFDKDGNASVKTNDMNLTVDAGSGKVTHKAASHAFDGDLDVTGNVNSTGQVAGASVTSGGSPVQTA